MGSTIVDILSALCLLAWLVASAAALLFVASTTAELGRRVGRALHHAGWPRHSGTARH
jgi:hypothetical protein